MKSYVNENFFCTSQQRIHIRRHRCHWSIIVVRAIKCNFFVYPVFLPHKSVRENNLTLSCDLFVFLSYVLPNGFGVLKNRQQTCEYKSERESWVTNIMAHLSATPSSHKYARTVPFPHSLPPLPYDDDRHTLNDNTILLKNQTQQRVYQAKCPNQTTQIIRNQTCNTNRPVGKNVYDIPALNNTECLLRKIRTRSKQYTPRFI